MSIYSGEDLKKADFLELENVVSPAPVETGTVDITRKAVYPAIANLTVEELRDLEKSMVRKIDFRLLPMFIINAIASARLAGLETDLNLSSAQYQLAVSILFVGYLLFQVPSNMLLSKIARPSIYLPTAMVIWGSLSTGTGGCNSYGSLMACRILLGCAEAAFFPGVLYTLSSWYTKKELGFRTSILYAGSLFSGMTSGLIAAGILDGMDGLHGLRAWRWLFFLEGGVTIGIAFISMFILPDFPGTTKWLTQEEKELAMWRLEIDAGESDEHENEGKRLLDGFYQAAREPKTWVLVLKTITLATAGGISNFFPSVVQTLGYGKIVTLCLTAPPWGLAIITSCFNSWHSDRVGERSMHIIIPELCALFAFILAAATTNTAARYVAMMIMVPGLYTSFGTTMAWISGSIPRPAAKRAASLALINCIGNSASIYSPFLYPSSSAPQYVLAMSVNAASMVISVSMVCTLRWMLKKENKALEAQELNTNTSSDEKITAPIGFRYVT